MAVSGSMIDISETLVLFWLLPVSGLVFLTACRLSCIFWTWEASLESASCTSVNCSAINGKLQAVLLPSLGLCSVSSFYPRDASLRKILPDIRS